MSSQNSNPSFSLPATGAISRFLRVKVDSAGAAVLAGATDRSVGTVVSQNPDYTVGVDGGRSGTKHYVAGAAVAAGAVVTGIAGGKVDDTAVSGAEILGYALESAAADGDIITVCQTSGATLA